MQARFFVDNFGSRDELESTGEFAVAFNLATSPIWGTFHTEATFTSTSYLISFKVIKGSQYKAILGLDFIDKHVESIKLTAGRIVLCDGEIVDITKRTYNAIKPPIRCCTTTTAKSTASNIDTCQDTSAGSMPVSMSTCFSVQAFPAPFSSESATISTADGLMTGSSSGQTSTSSQHLVANRHSIRYRAGPPSPVSVRSVTSVAAVSGGSMSWLITSVLDRCQVLVYVGVLHVLQVFSQVVLGAGIGFMLFAFRQKVITTAFPSDTQR